MKKEQQEFNVRDKVEIITLDNGMKGTIISKSETQPFPNVCLVFFIYNVRLRNGFIAREVKAWEMRIIK